ncbi:hypothetical protein RUND412_000037 [Rhizina undulata]
MKRERRTLSVPSISFSDSSGDQMDPGAFLGTTTPPHAPTSNIPGGWLPQQGQPPQHQQQQQHTNSSANLTLGKPPQSFNRSRSASISSLSAPTGGSPAGTPKKKIVTACQRCRTRKIRCDGALPACKSCVKAGVECMEVDRSGDNNMPRSHVLELENRIKWLEDVVSSRCPDVDLTSGPQAELRSRPSPPAIRIVTTGSDFHVPPQSLSSTSSPVFGLSPSSTCATPTSFDFSPGVSPGYLAPMSPFTFSDGPSPTPSPGPSSPLLQPQDPLAHEVGLLSLSATEEPKYIGASSGVAFARLIFADATDADFRLTDFINESGGGSDASAGRSWPGIDVEPAPLPSMDECQMFATTYFDTVHLQYPFLHRPTFDLCLEAAYLAPNGVQPPLPSGFTLNLARFHAFLVLSIGANILSSKVGHSLDSEGYFASAMRFVNDITLTGSLRGAQTALLLAMRSLHASGGLNIWYLNAIIMATCVDLGLQRKIMSMQGQEQAAIKKRVFWCAYALDRNIGVILGRPFTLRDEAFDVEFPDEGDNDEEIAGPSSLGGNLSPIAGTARAAFSNSIYLFRMIKILSEIKTTVYRVSHPGTRWQDPEWQVITHRRLNELRSQAQMSLSGLRRGSGGAGGNHLGTGQMVELKYQEAIQLLFRPSPVFQRPTTFALQQCFSSAIETIRIYNKLKRFGELPSTWMTAHSIFLSGITMINCFHKCREVQSATATEALVEDIRACSSLLSDLGQRWPGAQKSRLRFDALAQSTLALSAVQSSSRMLSPHDGARRASGGSHRGSISFPELQPHPGAMGWYTGAEQPTPRQGVQHVNWIDNVNWGELSSSFTDDPMLTGSAMEGMTPTVPGGMEQMLNTCDMIVAQPGTAGDAAMWGMDSAGS